MATPKSVGLALSFFCSVGFLDRVNSVDGKESSTGGVFGPFLLAPSAADLSGVFWLSCCLRGCVRVREAAPEFPRCAPFVSQS